MNATRIIAAGLSLSRSALGKRSAEAPHFVCDKRPDRVGTHLLYEDASVRIWRIELEADAETAWHTHNLDYVAVVTEGGVVERHNEDRSVDRFTLPVGHLMGGREETRTHKLRNVGQTTFSNVVVELKLAQPLDADDL